MIKMMENYESVFTEDTLALNPIPPKQESK